VGWCSITNMDLPALAASVTAARWRFATTMSQWPHVYTVRDWWDADDAFVEVCDLIQDRGRALPWPKPPSRPRYHNSYLVLAPLKFWAMGPRGDQDEPRDRNVVNCALAELDELAHDDAASVNQTGAWSDLLTRLSGLLQASSSPAPCSSTRDDVARGLSAACVRWSCRPGHYPLP
jgi:hypothetical protein